MILLGSGVLVDFLVFVSFFSFGFSCSFSILVAFSCVFLISFFACFISEFSILGFGMPDISDEEYRKNIKQWIQNKEKLDEKKFEKFQKHFFYESADLTKKENS